MSILLVNANAVNIPLANESVQCVITSPPYYGLRDYGTAAWIGGDLDCDHLSTATGSTQNKGNNGKYGAPYIKVCGKCGARRVDNQIGLEETPEQYVSKLVAVFREVWRVLKDDGTVFLNLGDSYFGSGKGGNPEGSKWAGFIGNKDREQAAMPHSNAQRVKSYDTFGKALEDYQDHDCLCGNLCDVCRVVYRRTFRTYDLLVSMLIASLSLTNPGYKELQSDHLPTSDLTHQVGRIFHAMPGLLSFQGRDDVQLRAFRESMPDGYSQQLLDVCLQRANHDECLLCARSLVGYVQESADNVQGCNCGTISPFFSSVSHTEGNGHNVYPYPHSTTKYLKPKDLIGIPWLVAFALRADGWYLRSDVIWHKPNPMPESVTDRPTKSHEYIFLLSKSDRYYYDAEAIKESAKVDFSNDGLAGNWAKPRIPNDNRERKRYTSDQAGSGRSIIGHSGNYKSNGDLIGNGMANKRSVWTVATQPYSGAHFATFPPALIEPCVKAGSKKGDIILDPFAGSGTTMQVARKLERHSVGCDLSLSYLRECAIPRLQLNHDEFYNGKKASGIIEDLPLFSKMP